MAREIKVSVEITAKDMFHFLMYHQYTSMTGIIYIIIGMMSLGMMFYAMFNMTALYTVVMALVFFVCIIYQPIGLYLKAAQQVKKNEAFSRPITYTFRDWDIEVRQGDSHGELPWDEITKAVVTKDMLLIYNGKVRANLLPLSQLGEDRDVVLARVQEKVKNRKVRGAGKGRK